ncbi:MAG: hypothetical protein LBL83_02200 [Clostridiales bacterium]|jgi:hypothetical protein|nr:hypothetical protein [Clostridiales bacterium]
MADSRRRGGQGQPPDRRIEDSGENRRGETPLDGGDAPKTAEPKTAEPKAAEPEPAALGGRRSGSAKSLAAPDAGARSERTALPDGSPQEREALPEHSLIPRDGGDGGDGSIPAVGDMLLPLLCAALLLVFPLYFIFADAPVFFENEKRYASTLPDFTAENALSGAWSEGAESWLADKMPLRSFWVGLNAYFAYATGRQNATDVYIDSRGDLLEKPAAFDAAELSKRIGKIVDFAGAANARTAVLAVPSAGYVAKPYLPGYVWSGYNDEALFAQISACIGDARPARPPGFIDVRGEFMDSGAPLFFRTDHHWNMDGAYTAYAAICRQWGLEPFPRDRFGVSRHAGFYGSTYSASGLWLTKADDIELWLPPEQVSVTFSDKDGEYGSLFFESHLAALDKYPVFLDGNHPLATVENMAPSAEARAAGTLLMIKDSYANSLVPLLIGHYSKIVLIDLRYYRQSASEVAAAQIANATGANAQAANAIGTGVPDADVSGADGGANAQAANATGVDVSDVGVPGADGGAASADARRALDILFVYSAKNLASDADLLWLR